MATYNGMTKSKSNFHLGTFLATGAAAANDITVTGINTSCTVIGAYHYTPGTTLAAVDLDNLTVTDDDTIQIAGLDTSSDQVLIFWTDESL